MKRILLLTGILAMAGILFACAPKAIPTKEIAPAEAQKPVSQDKAQEDWKIEWDKILVKAKKEGKVVLYTSLSPAARDALIQGFSSRTGISPDIVAGRGAQIDAKLLAERRAGLFVADVYIGGTTPLLAILKPAGALAPIKPALFLPEVLDTSLWYKNTLPWLDRDELILQTRMMPGGSQGDIAFMAGSINKQGFTSWYDLLKPQLKGRMSIQDPTTVGKGSKWVNKALTYYGLDWDYFKALAQQDLFITRDERLQIEWVVRGRHLFAINPDTDSGDEYRAAGAPMEYIIFKETKDILGGGSSGVSLLDKTPHPAAAKLFVNWFLSKEGQTYFARSYRVQSARMDTPTDHLVPSKIRQPGADYHIETEEFVLQMEKLLPQIIEIFTP